MEYNFGKIERDWQKYWKDNKTNETIEDKTKPKYYVLDMFPYPSGAGLHVGHPLGYIASDIFSRYKKLKGFNVLHPMGYDSFGLPAEQYAIQTGQHPAITTETNIARYREQLDKMGFCFDWDREVRTSSPEYYKWTQWIFKQLFNAWFNNDTNKAENISSLIAQFEENGNAGINACTDFEEIFTAERWKNLSTTDKENILQEYRMAFLADSWVNWCPALGTVLANDEVVNGVSERGGHPVEQKLMRQWSMRIKAYAQRLLDGLDKVDWTDSIKEIQRNWIGKSEGCSVKFKVASTDASNSAQSSIENSSGLRGVEFHEIEVFTTRPDTIFGVSFMVLAPEHELVDIITTPEQKSEIEEYKKSASLKSERDRQSDVKNITGAFTGAYAIHPFSGEKIQIWIGDYVLASYGTGAVMAVPCGDQRDWDFAKHFGIDIINIFEGVDISEEAYADKVGKIAHSDFLSGLEIKKAMKLAIHKIQEAGIGKGKILYRLRDAIFSRQRYWGEPFPVYFENDLPKLVEDDKLPIRLPEVDKYLPTEEGEPPLARATREAWKEQFQGDRMDYNTMPGWAGSSWYFLRYMDPKNDTEFVSKEKVDYWNNVDLYIGGAEHATGHLLYARFWTKFLNDMGYIPFDEPFQKMINQGMILGRSSFVYRLDGENKFVSNTKKAEYIVTPLHADIAFVENDVLDIEAFKKWRPEFKDAEFILEDDGTYICGNEVEKMSKSKYNVQTPDELVEKFGADTLRMYEMFLGPLEQSKPWDTKGINGVHNFLRKFWRLFHDAENNFVLSDGEPSKDNLKTLHKTIKKIGEDLERFSFNTGVSTFMICVNELMEQKCNNRAVLSELVVLLSPFAPHICEELWKELGNNESVTKATFPSFDEKHLVESSFEYPVSFNGKMRFKVNLDLGMSVPDMKKEILALEQTQKYLEGKEPKKVIIVPGKIVNFVV
jgi:leucyl-tRNA synthetase|tara:strand:+ start:4965 stop:7799 length:2835 start_codon:yes stop_codon:yes gene_type:complete